MDLACPPPPRKSPCGHPMNLAPGVHFQFNTVEHEAQSRDALEGKEPQSWPQRRLSRRLGAVTVSYQCH